MQPDTASVMNRIFARETRSILQYLKDAWPWASSDERKVLERLQQMIAEEQRAARWVADWLLRHHIPPATGRFPEEFTEINYVALDHLLPRLVMYQRQAMEELQKDLSQITNDEAQGIAQQLLALKRRHLEELNQMAKERAGKAISTLR